MISSVIVFLCFFIYECNTASNTTLRFVTFSGVISWCYYQTSSAVAEMGDRGHNRHGSKRGGCCAPFAVSSKKFD